MSNRLQRWGERALGQVQSVSPRVSSRFEPEPGASAFEDQEGFREVEIDEPARSVRRQVAAVEPLEAITRPPPRQEHPGEQPEPPRVSGDASLPPVVIETSTPLPPHSPPVNPRERVAEPAASLRKEAESRRQAKIPDEDREQPARPAPLPEPEVSEPSLVRWQRFRDWMAAPPREQPSAPELPEAPVPGSTPFPVNPRPSPPVAPAPRLLSAPRTEPPPTPEPPPPVVVNIGTIIVRTNPAAAPKPAAPPPAAGLAAFLARRTAGEP